MRAGSFYEKMSPESRVKVQIVTKYFDIWSKIISSSSHCSAIGYLDFFAGPGLYKDGTPSTPLRILSAAAKHPRVASTLHSYLNDGDPQNVKVLKTAIENNECLAALRHAPIIDCMKVGQLILPQIRSFRNVPTLSFVDPFGYKGVTAELLKETMIGRGSECLLFFNFNRFNHALSNETVVSHARQFFGESSDQIIPAILRQTNPELREQAIVTAVSNTLQGAGARYLIFFKFEQEGSNRTSHYIVFATKHELGLQKMKEVMASESSEMDGITVFGWMPNVSPQLTLGFFGEEARSSMKELMLSRYEGASVRFEDLYKSVGLLSPYAEKDFKKIINELELEGTVVIDKPRDKRVRLGQVTLGEDRVITFCKET